ncbi:TadE/TadG family type IV pilus assembly protein [Desulfotruncus alcoholivorax]|uniref:TadE/TadG family type IV pilus assembly protein n=1 Tax=Desulfotruncus alcoholivorax TaxID=265477 RepID=UPI000421FEB1|nr:TadE/TadG family type IV pilus assembly protein [Desulfotruncus alcoholivorax]
MLVKLIKNQKGALSTTFAVLLPLILIVMALVLDGFRIFVLKHELQSVVDSSALAGASAVEGKLTIDPVTGLSTGNDKLALDANMADIYAVQLLNENIAAHNFTGQGINNIQIVEHHAIDKNVDGTLDGYFIKVTANIDSLLYGQLTGAGKTIQINREAEAVADKD